MDWLLAEVGLAPFTLGRLMGYFYLAASQFVHWPQLFKILKDPRRDTRAISLTTYCAIIVMVLSSLAYGIYLHSWPIIVNNVIGLCVNAAIFGIKARNAWKYRSGNGVSTDP